eukprot:jgi/Chlat1/1542/Chrsp122S01812
MRLPLARRLATFAGSGGGANGGGGPAGFTRRTLLNIGDVYETERTFGQEQVAQFAALTADRNPIHLDEVAAMEQGYAKPIVHGLLYAGMFPAIIATQFPGAVYLNQTLRFREPVYVGDALIAEVAIHQISGRKVAFDTQCVKAETGARVLDGTALALLPPEWEQPVDEDGNG